MLAAERSLGQKDTYQRHTFYKGRTIPQVDVAFDPLKTFPAKYVLPNFV